MKHYEYQKTLFQIWERAVEAYSEGNEDVSTYFNPEQKQFIAATGGSEQEYFDYAEDYVSGGEPDFATVAMVMDIRRHYFLNKQGGQPSSHMMDPDKLPAKKDEVDGISWLPRIIEKAKSKLKGELHPNMMYGCGGDRNFFKTHDIHSAEFLRVVEENIDNDRAIIEWVKSRSPQVP